jgi:hypothetical protein
MVPLAAFTATGNAARVAAGELYVVLPDPPEPDPEPEPQPTAAAASAAAARSLENRIAILLVVGG